MPIRCPGQQFLWNSLKSGLDERKNSIEDVMRPTRWDFKFFFFYYIRLLSIWFFSTSQQYFRCAESLTFFFFSRLLPTSTRNCDCLFASVRRKRPLEIAAHQNCCFCAAAFKAQYNVYFNYPTDTEIILTLFVSLLNFRRTGWDFQHPFLIISFRLSLLPYERSPLCESERSKKVEWHGISTANDGIRQKKREESRKQSFVVHVIRL